NPLKMVAVFTRFDTRLPANNQVILNGAASDDGGLTWSPLTIPGNLTDPNSSLQNPAPFAQSTDASVAIDRNENVYLLYSEHTADNSAGAFVLQKYDFSSPAPPLFIRPPSSPLAFK